MKNKALKRNLCFFAIFSLIEYLIFHIIYLSSGVGTLALHIIRFSLTVFPPLVGVGVIRSGVCTRNNILDITYIYIARLPFFFLYIYVIAHELFRMKTIEITLYAILFSLVVALIYFSLSLLVYFIIKGKLKKRGVDADGLFPIKITDFKSPVVTGLLTLPLIFFSLEFLYEVYNTVIYFLSYANDYRLAEIVYLVLQYLFILFKLVITMLLSKLLVNRVLVPREESDE